MADELYSRNCSFISVFKCDSKSVKILGTEILIENIRNES